MAREHLPPVEDLRAVLERPGAVRAVFQPIMDLRTGTIAGYEALARFPDRFNYEVPSWFESAHRYGLGPRLEALALQAALAKTRRPAETFLSVNVSPTAFISEEVQSILSPSLEGVVIEITENQLIEAEDPVHKALALARARGARVAVDDVGAGYAGLALLMRVMPEIIKLDRSVVANAHEELTRAALVESLVRYGERTHTLVCAEGIESREELVLMVELGVAYGQGFAIGRPSTRWRAPSRLATDACPSGDESSPEPDSSGERAAGLDLLSSQLARASTPVDLNRAAESVASALVADEVYVSRLVAEERCLEVIAGFGGPGIGLCYRLSDYPATAAVIRGSDAREVLASDPSADPAEVRLLLAQGIKALLMVPIAEGEKPVGLLELYRRVERPWDEGAIAAACAMSRQFGAVMERLRKLGRLNGKHPLIFDSTPLPEMVRRRVGL
jgi:EAL domain-containing protein (putative c-di-GMP-specific phosphodiesterase class I)